MSNVCHCLPNKFTINLASSSLDILTFCDSMSIYVDLSGTFFLLIVDFFLPCNMHYFTQ